MSGHDAFWAHILATAEALDDLDYYELLGVGRDAEVDAIRNVYWDLVRKIHPDQHMGEPDPERTRALVVLFARVGESYRVLTTPAKRKAYDALLATGVKRLPKGHPTPTATETRDPKTERARALYEKGKLLLVAGDRRGARAQWGLAIQFEPTSKVLRAALDELEAASTGSHPKLSRPEPAPSKQTGELSARALADASSRREPSQARAVTMSPVAAELDGGGASAGHTVTIRCSSWDHVTALYRRKLVRGAVVVRTSHVPPRGSPVKLAVRFPDGHIVGIPAEVAGGDTRTGMKLSIPPLGEDTKRLFESVGASTTARGSRAASSDRFAPVDDDPAAAGRRALRAGDPRAAANALTLALIASPDDRGLRAAYYLALAEAARADGRDSEAELHRQTARHFDPSCERLLGG